MCHKIVESAEAMRLSLGGVVSSRSLVAFRISLSGVTLMAHSRPSSAILQIEVGEKLAEHRLEIMVTQALVGKVTTYKLYDLVPCFDLRRSRTAADVAVE